MSIKKDGTPRKRGSGGARAGSGRKPMDLNLEEIEKLSELQCTDIEIAAWFRVSVKTIENKRKEAAYADAMDYGKGKGRISLRRLIKQSAENGNIAAQIFLCKTVLQMREQVEVIERPSAVRYGWVKPKKESEEPAEALPVNDTEIDGVDPLKVQ